MSVEPIHVFGTELRRVAQVDMDVVLPLERGAQRIVRASPSIRSMPTAKAESLSPPRSGAMRARPSGMKPAWAPSGDNGPFRTVDWHLRLFRAEREGRSVTPEPGGPNRHIAKDPSVLFANGTSGRPRLRPFASHRRMRSLLAIGPRHAGSFAPI